MNNMTVCSLKDCSGCGACLKSCPKKCINLIEDEIGALVANIDENLCVGCNICRKVCHINKEKNFIFPKKAFAGWSNDEETHSNGASGGIASEIIKFAVNNNIFIMGTRFYRDKGVVFEKIKNINDLNWARDSKYVYSDMRSCFELYAENMRENRKCIYIGLPCQVSALKSYIELKNLCLDNIILVEIICHGVPPFKYLDEHLKMIENKKKDIIGIMTWRNPNSIFLLQCKTVEDRLLYSKGMHEDDTYYRAFALNLNFRESCYKCQYARSERIADFTLGDYSGLGQLWPYDGNKQMVSVILCNTTKGEMFLNHLSEQQYINLIERPLAEPFSALGNPQIRHPSIPFKTRGLFLKEYLTTGSYEKAAKKALKSIFIKYYLKLPFLVMRKIVALFLPKKMKEKIKQIIK